MYEHYRFPMGKALDDDLRSKPEHQKVWSRNDRNAHPSSAADYFGCNSFIDGEIGRVLSAIQQFAPKSLVLYTSDHGDMLGRHGIRGKGPAMYDDITNIPLLVSWPGRTPGGPVCDHPVSHINIAPSLLEYYGITCSKIIEGVGILKCFEDPTVRINREIFMEFGRYEIDHDGFGGFQPIRCIYDGRYKLAVNLLTTDELYDLQEDPDELYNRIEAPEYAGIRNNLHDRLFDWMNSTRDPFRGCCWFNRPWRTGVPRPNWDSTGMTRQREEDERYEKRQLDYLTGMEMTHAVRKKG